MNLGVLVWKDLRREVRSKESLQAGLVLVGLFFVLYLFAITDLQDPVLAAVAVWTPILYGTAALSARGMGSEVDRGTLAWLRSAPVPVAWHGWSRTLVNLGLTAMLAAIALLLGAAGFLMPLNGPMWLVAGLAVVGLAIAGTLAGGLAAQARGREVLMPILLIPVAAPLVQAGIAATFAAMDGDIDRSAILLMAGYDIIIAGLAYLLWPFALESD